jgi:hypothetical protein
MMCAVKITSGPERTQSDRSATTGFGPRHAQAVVTAIVGLAFLAAVHSAKWVAVRPGQTFEDQLLGRAPSDEVLLYGLADFPVLQAVLFAGWGLLLAMMVAAWVRPKWRQGLQAAAVVLGLALTFLTLLIGSDAVDASGFVADLHPHSEFLKGTWLALGGTVALVRAVLILTVVPKPSPAARPIPAQPTPLADTTSPADTAPPADTTAVGEPAPPAGTAPPADTTAVGEPAPLAGTAAGGSAPAVETIAARRPALAGPSSIVIPPSQWTPRPAPIPWWRRPWRVAGAVVAFVAAVAFVGSATWSVIHAQQGRDGDLGPLVVTLPADSTPTTPAAVDDRLDATRIVPLSGDFQSLILAGQLSNTVEHAAGAAWTRPDSATVTVTLLQFDSRSSAAAFQQSYTELQPPGIGPGDSVPDVPGALAFTDLGHAEVRAIAHRDETVMLVTMAGGPSDAITTVESVIREQYGRL